MSISIYQVLNQKKKNKLIQIINEHVEKLNSMQLKELTKILFNK